MAAPKDSPEQAFRLRQFQGTNTEIDSAFLGPSLLARSENWIPTQSYRLGKRPGTTLVAPVNLGTNLDITDLLAARSATGDLSLYAYCRRPVVPDALIATSVNEGPFVASPPGVTFASPTAVGRMVRFRDRVYAGNGVDPMKSWLVGGSDVQTYGALSVNCPLGVVGDAPASAAVPSFPSGGYDFCWALFNPTTGLYVARGGVQHLNIPAQSVMTVTAPAVDPNAAGADYPAGTGRVYRFFLAPRGYPIEYATAQSGNLATSQAFTLSVMDVTDLRVPITGIVRTGNMLIVWRNRVVFSGQASDPYSVFATDTILPGLEQVAFNQGTFFPVNAKVPLPGRVTGIGVAGVTSDMEAQAPLLFFTLSKTFMCNGDPFSATTPAELVELSSRVGCIGHDSIVNTPHGILFCGLDSVYLVPPGGGYPQDVGGPIADQIRAIAPTARSQVTATFHKQFYKLSIPPGGSSANTEQWWLDLRQGIGSPPSWWGPMTIRVSTGSEARIAISALTTDIESAVEIDRGYAAYAGTDRVVRTHQLATYTDYTAPTAAPTPVKSTLRSGRFDADAPFTAKVFTRLRLIAQTGIHTFIEVNFKTDGGDNWEVDPIELGRDIKMPGEFSSLPPDPVPPGPPLWQSWSTDPDAPRPGAGSLVPKATRAQFATIAPVEVQTITPATRPRGLSAIVTLIHDPTMQPPGSGPHQGIGNIELRDFELLFIPSERKVRFVGESTGK